MPVNTGEQEKEQRDINPNSPTYGQVRWVTAGQNLTACPPPSSTFRSAAISETVFKNDCPGNSTTTGITYTMAAGYYVSTTSQTDADQHARADFDANKQGYANANGTCTISGGTNPGGGGSGYSCLMNPGPGGSQCWTGMMSDGINTYFPTVQDCQDCNAQQDARCGLVAC